MKKKILIPIIIFLLLLILFVPIPSGVYKDGGTKAYTALTYKIVDWNRITGDLIYDETRIYPFPANFKSIDQLWHLEEDNIVYSFTATVLEIGEDYVLVEPIEGEMERSSSDKISFGIKELPEIGAKVGSMVEVLYNGLIMELYPAKIHASGWNLLNRIEYDKEWLSKKGAEKCEDDIFSDIIITKIYADCFFAQPVIPMPYEIKLNGKLSADWCVGDQVICTYDNTYYDRENYRVEADMLTIAASDFQLDPNVDYKPVIYLYPEQETEVEVTLTLDGKFLCTYPKYQDGWRVTASPDGVLTDEKGQTYNYLYWEGETYARYDLSRGFCVKGEDTATFLEDALAKLGLNRKEANEFIVYWLPLMEPNLYNIIAFQTDIYTDAAKLEVTPATDTVIRVFMAWQPAEEAIALPAQELSAPKRTGFTVVEWGGTKMQEW